MFDCSDRINKKNMFAKNGLEKFEFHWIWHYLFKTLNHIIFAVFVPDLINNSLPILGSILERGARGWHVQYRQKMMRDLQGQWSYCIHTGTCYHYKNLIPRTLNMFLFPGTDHQIKEDAERKNLIWWCAPGNRTWSSSWY